MMTTVQRWGGVRLSKQVLEEARLTPGDGVEVSFRAGMLVIVPSRCIRGRYCLEDLASSERKRGQAEELPWGAPAGNEVW